MATDGNKHRKSIRFSSIQIITLLVSISILFSFVWRHPSFLTPAFVLRVYRGLMLISAREPCVLFRDGVWPASQQKDLQWVTRFVFVINFQSAITFSQNNGFNGFHVIKMKRFFIISAVYRLIKILSVDSSEKPRFIGGSQEMPELVQEGLRIYSYWPDAMFGASERNYRPVRWRFWRPTGLQIFIQW